MKPFTKVLLGLLVLTSLIPFYIGILCLFNQPKAIEFFTLESQSRDIQKILFVLGGFMLATIVLPIIAIKYLVDNKSEGFTLSLVVGAIALLRGLLTAINFSGADIVDGRLSVTPIVIGVLIIVATLLARNQHRKQFLR
jgi:hypothetical protein